MLGIPAQKSNDVCLFIGSYEEGVEIALPRLMGEENGRIDIFHSFNQLIHINRDITPQ